MMKLLGTIVAGTTLAIAPAALAQTAPQSTTQSTPATAPTPAATPTAAATPLVVTDAEVAKFAAAALEINKIAADTTIPAADKNAKMAAAATNAGLDAARFNAIGNAMKTDEALNKRIQDAATKIADTAPAATPGQQ